MGEALRQEVRDLDIDVVMIEPGAVKTGFDEATFATLDRIEFPKDYSMLMRGFRSTMEKSYQTCPGPDSTVKAMVQAATARKPKTIYKTTTDAKVYPRMKAMLSDRAFDGMFISMFKKAADKR